MVSTPQPSMFPDITSAPRTKRLYLDSTVFIAHIKKEMIPTSSGLMRYEITQHLMEDAEADKFIVVTSTVTLAEVRRIKKSTCSLKDEERQEVNDFFKKFLENGWLLPVDVTREIGERAQDLGAKYNLTPIDAIHVISAMRANCPRLFVWDKDTMLNRFPSGKVECVMPDGTVQSTQVMEPVWEGVSKLPIKKS